MESVELDVLNGEKSNLVVQIMVMPGFRIGDTVIKSRVYVLETEESADSGT